MTVFGSSVETSGREEDFEDEDCSGFWTWASSAAALLLVKVRACSDDDAGVRVHRMHACSGRVACFAADMIGSGVGR